MKKKLISLVTVCTLVFSGTVAYAQDSSTKLSNSNQKNSIESSISNSDTSIENLKNEIHKKNVVIYNKLKANPKIKFYTDKGPDCYSYSIVSKKGENRDNLKAELERITAQGSGTKSLSNAGTMFVDENGKYDELLVGLQGTLEYYNNGANADDRVVYSANTRNEWYGPGEVEKITPSDTLTWYYYNSDTSHNVSIDGGGFGYQGGVTFANGSASVPITWDSISQDWACYNSLSNVTAEAYDLYGFEHRSSAIFKFGSRQYRVEAFDSCRF